MRDGGMVKSLAQWGRASKGASFSSMRGRMVFTSGHSGFQVKWMAMEGRW